MRWTAILTLLLGLTIGACSADATADGPPEINCGREVCLQCGMIISEVRYAAAYRLPDGTEKKFDDLGGLVVYGRENGELASAEVWVHDVETEEWLPAGEAWFVMTGDGRTPMGFGIIAFSDKQRATQVAQGLEAGVLTWEDVTSLPSAALTPSMGG